MNQKQTVHKNIFNICLMKEFCKTYNITFQQLKTENIYYFRFLCFMFNAFIKHMVLPNFNVNSIFEAILIEFRNFPHIEFLIRNAILKLGPKWSHTVMCGNLNYEMVKKICTNISPNIRIVKLNENNITQSEYSFFLTTANFWNYLNGEKILIYQEDSIIFKNNIQSFLEYDFIGAPFSKQSNDTPNGVGNGGLSLRTKQKMLETIKICPVSKCHFNSSTTDYMKFVNLGYPPEDVYFSKCMQELNIGDVASWNAAHAFSSEIVFNPDSFGGHKFWLSCENWTNHMKNIFMFSTYKQKSNLNDYLNFLGIRSSTKMLNTSGNKNAFDVDLYFFSKVNNLEYHNKLVALENMKQIGLRGIIYHPKQLLNIYPNVEFYHFLNNIYVFHNQITYNIQDFVSNHIYNLDFQRLSNVLIKQKYSCLNDNYDILLLVFIGYETIGIDLVERIIEYKKIEPNFNVAFCINRSLKNSVSSNNKVSSNNNVSLKQLIKNNFDFYAIYKSKELGNDIVPTLLMYNDICKSHTFKHILKFHTKSIKNAYNDLTNYLLSNSISQLNYNNQNQSNCIGCPGYWNYLDNDIYNNELKIEHASVINKNNYFIAGTIFYTRSEIFDKMIDFIKTENYKCYLLNNMYENNSINQDYSPIHFLERLFGVIYF